MFAEEYLPVAQSDRRSGSWPMSEGMTTLCLCRTSSPPRPHTCQRCILFSHKTSQGQSINEICSERQSVACAAVNVFLTRGDSSLPEHSDAPDDSDAPDAEYLPVARSDRRSGSWPMSEGMTTLCLCRAPCPPRPHTCQRRILFSHKTSQGQSINEI